MSLLWQPPLPLPVEADAAGVPSAFRWQGQWHPVRQVVRRWRVDVGWWEAHHWRDVFQVLTETGLLAEVFCDLAAGGWFLQRLYD